MENSNWWPREEMCCCMSCLDAFHISKMRSGKCPAGHVMYRQEEKPSKEEELGTLET
jgi:hypothetical protein